jgi:hypothetical protein
MALSLGFYGAAGSLPPVVEGGTVTDSGQYRYHTFLSSGTFMNPFDDLVVQLSTISGGGSASTSYHGGGGGGAGGFSETNPTLAKGDYIVAIGAGGATTTSTNATATKGNATTVSILNTNIPGGGGGVTNFTNTSVSDGSSGGGTCNVGSNPGYKGLGIAGLGRDGGSSFQSNTQTPHAGGGGGGFSAVGQDAQSPNYGGVGGAGVSKSTLASATATGDGGFYCGGGAGGIDGQAVGAGTSDAIQGGTGGGGNSGVYFGSNDGQAGLVNTGGGGGAPNSKGSGYGGAGGSGLVIFRYLISAVE